MRIPAFPLIVLSALFIVLRAFAAADPVPARLKQGAGHIFLLILDENGRELAARESLQTVKGYTVTTRTTFHFCDGSLDDETTVFEQRAAASPCSSAFRPSSWSTAHCPLFTCRSARTGSKATWYPRVAGIVLQDFTGSLRWRKWRPSRRCSHPNGYPLGIEHRSLILLLPQPAALRRTCLLPSRSFVPLSLKSKQPCDG